MSWSARRAVRSQPPARASPNVPRSRSSSDALPAAPGRLTGCGSSPSMRKCWRTSPVAAEAAAIAAGVSTIRGARSAKRVAASPRVHKSGGSSTWLSAEITRITRAYRSASDPWIRARVAAWEPRRHQPGVLQDRGAAVAGRGQGGQRPPGARRGGAAPGRETQVPRARRGWVLLAVFGVPARLHGAHAQPRPRRDDRDPRRRLHDARRPETSGPELTAHDSVVLHGGFEYGFTAGHEGLTFITIRNGVAETNLAK